MAENDRRRRVDIYNKKKMANGNTRHRRIIILVFGTSANVPRTVPCGARVTFAHMSAQQCVYCMRTLLSLR